MAFLAKTYHDYGMARDTDVAVGKDTLAYENFNIRITARDRETLLSVTNDRGNVRVMPERWIVLWNDPEGKDRSQGFAIVSAREYNDGLPDDERAEKWEDEELHLMGTVIGYNVLNSYVTLFTTEGEGMDHIYRVEYVPGGEPSEWRGLELLSGDYGFDAGMPIETLGDYENDDVLKVYWLDGVNQPRVINISDRNITENGIGDWTKIDFVAEFSPTLKVTVEKVYEGTAVFGAGIVQYVFTYGSKYGQQSNIVHVSPVYYASPSGRGGSPEESVNCQFRITVSGYDTTWRWLNVYRLMQTSESGQWTADRVARLDVGDGEAVYTDDGSSAESVDPAEMLYVGGREISAYTMCAKDQTLFLGNLRMLTTESDHDIINAFADHRGAAVNLKEGISELLSFRLTEPDGGHSIPYSDNSGYYPYSCQLDFSGDVIRTFKAGEKYRIGMRFVTKAGTRTGVYWVGDVEQTLYPEIDARGYVNKAMLVCSLPPDLVLALEGKGYVQAELMMAERTVRDRSVQAQGIVVPTVFNIGKRISDAPYAYSSWYARPRRGTVNDGRMVGREFEAIPVNDAFNAEIQCISKERTAYANTSEVGLQDTNVVWALRVHRMKDTVRLSAHCDVYRVHASTKAGSGEKYELGEKIGDFGKNGLRRDRGSAGDLADDIVKKLKSKFNIIVNDETKLKNFCRLWQLHNSKDHWYYYDTDQRYYAQALDSDLDLNSFYSGDVSKEADDKCKTEPDADMLVKYCSKLIGPFGSSLGELYAQTARNNFFVDEGVCTFHTPELTDYTFGTFENSNMKFRIVGLAEIGSNITDYSLEVGNFSDTSNGVVDFSLSRTYKESDPSGLMTLPFYQGYVFNQEGAVIEDEGDSEAKKNEPYGNAMSSGMWIYPWHKTGSMTYRAQGDTDDSGSLADMAVRGEDQDVLKTKTESNLRFSLLTRYEWGAAPWVPSGGIYPLKVFNSDEETLKIIETPFGQRTYQGNYDVLLSCVENTQYAKDGNGKGYIDYMSEYDDGYVVYDTGFVSLANSVEELMKTGEEAVGENGKMILYRNETVGRFYDPVDITVKSTPHLLVSFRNDADGALCLLPNVVEVDSDGDENEDFDFVGTPESPEDGTLFLPWNYSTSVDVDGLDAIPLIVPVPSPDGNDPAFDPECYLDVFSPGEEMVSGEEYGIVLGREEYDFESLDEEIGELVDEYGVNPVFVFYMDRLERLYYALRYVRWQWYAYELPAPWGLKFDGETIVRRGETFSLKVTAECPAEGHLVMKCDGFFVKCTTEGNVGTADFGVLESEGEYVIELRTFNDEDYDDGHGVRFKSSEFIGRISVKVSAEDYDDTYSNPYYRTVRCEPLRTDIVEEETTEPDMTLVGTPLETAAYLFNGTGYNYRYESHLLDEVTVSGFALSEGNPLTLEDGVCDNPYYFIAELYNDFSENDSRYGGTTDYAVRNNTFIPLGNVTALDGASELTAYAGDTYFQRWDCQKTCKWSDEAENNINEFVSVMLETYHNIEGRYDVRRGLLNNQATTPENSNLFNGAYDNLGTLFSGNVLDEKYSLDEYPAQLTWTLDKTPGADVDSWTNVTLASVLDLDGSKGPIEALRTHANSIFAFQDRGIAEVLFNTRTQLATTEGVPVEIANSGRVDGKRYVTERNGCRDKWSIGVTKGGLWFADGLNGTINRVAQQVEDVSTRKGMSVWTRARCGAGIWDPVEYGAFAAFADTTRDEVYFCRPMEGDRLDAVCFSEVLDEFTSFHGYGALSAMFNVGDRLLAFRDAGDGESGMWLQGEGRHGEFFGELQDWYVQFRAAPDPYGDKTFTNLEYRADVFDMSEPNPYMEGEGRLTGRTFDSLRVWDEYQGNEVELRFDALRDAYPDMRRLNRIWRTDIPRARRGEDNPFGLNRIRNPWVWLRLTGTTPEEGDYMMNFHDLTVKYIE